MVAMAPVVEELPDNKVRITVDVPREDVHHAVEHAASDLAATVKIPGFRKGKVPKPVLVSRIGKERLYTEAIESHIAGWYGNAVARARIRPAEQPELDYELPASDDEDWRFTATVSVLPKPAVAEWKQLQVPYAEPEVPEDYVDHELNVLRSTIAELSPVEDRPTQLGDTVVIDLVARDGGQRDYVVELGSGRLLPELEDQLVGMSVGETKDVSLERLRDQVQAEVDEAFRRATLDRLVEASNVRVSGPLVDARTRTLLRELDTVMRRSGGSLEAYLQLSGEPAENLVARLREQAAASVAGELVLEAAADQLGIDVSEQEVEEAFRDRFDDADTVLEQAREAGAFESERESMRMARTLDRIAQEVERVPPEQAEARERIWTPDKEKPKTEAKLWT